MNKTELKHLKIDHKYVFQLWDGRELIKRGSWLATTKDGHWAIDPEKIALIKTVKDTED